MQLIYILETVYLTILLAPQPISEPPPQPAFGLQLVSTLHPVFGAQPISGQTSVHPMLGQASEHTSKNRGAISYFLFKFTISYDFKLKNSFR